MFKFLTCDTYNSSDKIDYPKFLIEYLESNKIQDSLFFKKVESCYKTKNSFVTDKSYESYLNLMSGMIKFLTRNNVNSSDKFDDSTYINFLTEYLMLDIKEQYLFVKIVESFYKKKNLNISDKRYESYVNLMHKMINKGFISAIPEYYGDILCFVLNKYYNDDFAIPLNRNDSRIVMRAKGDALYFLIKDTVCIMTFSTDALVFQD